MRNTFLSERNPSAKLLVELPADRYRVLCPEGRVPQIGDVVALDQSFTGVDGLPMVVAYFPTVGSSFYEAEIYESELECVGIGQNRTANH